MPHTFRYPSPHTAGSHLRVDGLSFSYPDRRVLTNISFVVPAGDRMAVIGENGSGKSTLLQAVSGALMPSSGTISLSCAHPEEPAIGLLHQEPSYAPASTVATTVETAVAATRRAITRVNDLGAEMASRPTDLDVATAFAFALETAERLGAWELDARISRILDGLGLGAIDRTRRIGTLSGGQRARLSLACLLLGTPELLLLDEPTNHLDDDATAFLVSVLTNWQGPLVVASHDRAFLDESTTSLLDLDPAPLPHRIAEPFLEDGTGTGIGVTRFTGTYSDYVIARTNARRRWERQFRDEQSELVRLRAAVAAHQTVGHENWRPRSEVRMAQKFYADRNARVVSRRVSDARARLAELEVGQIQGPPQELTFQGLTREGEPGVRDVPGPLLIATDVVVAARLRESSLGISAGEHCLVTGPNGSGKSTLLGVLHGSLEPDAGQIWRAPGLRVGLLRQELALSDPMKRGAARTAAESYADLVGPERAERIPLGTFGLMAARDHNRPVRELSVGQQRRLALATLLADPPDVLLLDEPTNHFSLDLVNALEEALTEYSGAVVIASHDRWLRRRWTGQRRHLLPPP